jgi:dipeptidase D
LLYSGDVPLQGRLCREEHMKGKLLSDLKPRLVWDFFEQLSRIPRCTKKEQKVRGWIKDWAGERCREDGAGNFLLQRAASRGSETHPTLVLQAHLDMVCLKDERSRVDFDNDAIPIRVEGSRVRAQGTTLGADNGIGVACCLAALIDAGLVCGPLEVLLTVDEEEGAADRPPQLFGCWERFLTDRWGTAGT